MCCLCFYNRSTSSFSFLHLLLIFCFLFFLLFFSCLYFTGTQNVVVPSGHRRSYGGAGAPLQGNGKNFFQAIFIEIRQRGGGEFGEVKKKVITKNGHLIRFLVKKSTYASGYSSSCPLHFFFLAGLIFSHHFTFILPSNINTALIPLLPHKLFSVLQCFFCLTDSFTFYLCILNFVSPSHS